jgi:hypothetical protein
VNSIICFPSLSGQSSHNPNILTDPKKIYINYCKQFEDSVAIGIDAIEELIAAEIVPSSYYGKTYQEETKSLNHVNLLVNHKIVTNQME